MRNQDACNVLFISHVSHIGGAELSLADLVRTLDATAFQPIVVCPRGGPFVEEIERSGVPVHQVNIVRFKRTGSLLATVRGAARMPLAVRALANIVRQHDVRIIHSNGTRAQMYGAVAARLTGVPSVWHVRDSVRLGLLGRTLESLSTKIIVPSQSVLRRVFGERTERARIVVIPPGLDLGRWCAEAALANRANGLADGSDIRADHGVGRGEIVVAMVAQLVPWKRQQDFIAAAAMVARTHANARFLIIGEDTFGDHRRYCEDLRTMVTTLGLDGKVIFTGWREDMVRVMASIDILALPSLNEPFGRVVIEAMAMQKPVIATNDGGPAEIIEEGVSGHLVPSRQPEALAKSMGSLIESIEERKRMGAAGRALVEARFDLRNSVARIESLYRELVRLH